MKSINIALFTILITGLSLAQQGSITNFNTAQRTDGSMMVDIYYDLSGPNPPYLITVEASFNGGANFTPISQVSGDVGAGVTTGTGKHIIWNFGAEFPGSYSTSTKIRIRAYLNDCFYFTDARDGQEYTTVKIGTQCWMAENLNIGTMIPVTTEMTNNSIIEKYCYNNSMANCDVYGGLYQWNEMMEYSTTPGVQGICPAGWHLPTDAEWTILTTFLGGESVAGGKMKATGTIEAGTGMWYAPNTGATNESGFSALPGGGCSTNGGFSLLGNDAFFWSSAEGGSESAWRRYLGYDYADVYAYLDDKYYGFSSRCIKD